MVGRLAIGTSLTFFLFSFHISISGVFAQTRDDAEKWLKIAKDTLALVEKTAEELVQGGIENIAQKDQVVKGEWESAKEWLSLAKEELKKAEDLCAKGKWAECSHSANWAWQLLVKCATQAFNAGRAARLK